MLLLSRRSQTPAFRYITAAQPANFMVSYERPVLERPCRSTVEAANEQQQQQHEREKRLTVTV